MRALFFAVALCACSIPTKHADNGTTDAPQGTTDTNPNTPDGPPADANTTPDAAVPDAGGAFACLGQPLPTTAPATIVFNGTIGDPLTSNAGANAPVILEFTGFDPVNLTADASGAWGPYTQVTNGAPVDGPFLVQQTGYLETFVYPAVPYVKDATMPAMILTSAQAQEVAGFSGDTYDSTKAQLIVHVADCNGAPVSGATVSTAPAGTVRYFSGIMPSATATATDSSGNAIVYNVAPGQIMIHAMASVGALRAHTVQGGAGSLTETGIQP